MIKHVKSSHTIEDLHSCNDCLAYFTEEGLNEHKSRVHNQKSFICSVCSLESASLQKHQEHECSDFWQKTKKEQNQEKYVIQEPDNLKDRQQKVSEDEKLDHVLAKGEVGFKCKFCIETFENKDLQTNHITEEHLKKGTKQDYFRCSFCNIFVLDEPNLLNHVAKDHAIEKGEIYRPYKCHSCPENTFFRYSHELKKHLEAHDKDNLPENIKKKGFQINPTNSVYVVKNPYKCHICDLSSKTKYLLDLHIKTVHNQRNQQKTSVTEMVDLKPDKDHRNDDVPEMNNVTETKVTYVEQINKVSEETNLKSPSKKVKITLLGGKKVHKGGPVKITMLGVPISEFKNNPEYKKEVNSREEENCDEEPTEPVDTLDVHEEKDVPNTDLQCMICSSNFSDFEELAEHVEEKHYNSS